MNFDNEHWVIDNQVGFKGLWTIDGKNTGASDMWDRIEQIIAAYTKVHPLEMELLVRENAEISKSRINDTASSKAGIRWGLSIPHGLLFEIQTLYPELFLNKNLFHKFLKKYKGLRICKNV
jgi:hypothetical protein